MTCWLLVYGQWVGFLGNSGLIYPSKRLFMLILHEYGTKKGHKWNS